MDAHMVVEVQTLRVRNWRSWRPMVAHCREGKHTLRASAYRHDLHIMGVRSHGAFIVGDRHLAESFNS